MEEIFIIEQIWMDSMENQSSATVGYKPIGWVSTEKEAKDIVAKGRLHTKSDCWAIYTPIPEYTYKKLTKCKTTHQNT